MRSIILAVLSVVTFLFSVFFYLYDYFIGFEFETIVICDILPVILALLAAIYIGYCAKSAIEPSEKKAILLFFIGIFLWFLGELLWFWYEAILQIETPYPSVADILWILGFLPFIGGAAYYLKSIFLPTNSKIKKTVIFLASVSVFVILTLVLFVPVIKADISLIEKIIDFFYPIGDFILFILSLYIATIQLKTGPLGKPWLIFSLAFLLFSVSDMLFSWATFKDIYGYGYAIDFLDLLYNLAYVLFPIACYLKEHATKTRILSLIKF